MFSKACEYGIRATIYIGQQSEKNRRVSLKDVAEAIDSPLAFTAKILQALAREQIIDSVKGTAGGYEIPDHRMEEITLLHIVQSIDGDKIYNGCALGLSECNEDKPCPLHYQFVSIRDELKDLLETSTVGGLSTGLNESLYFLKR